MNVGAFLAPLGCGTVGELYGWHWGFTLAGIGMVGRPVHLYLRQPLPAARAAARRARRSRSFGNTGTRRELARRFALLAGICGVVVVFRGAYEQIGNTLPLWIEHVDRSVGAFTIPMTWFQSLNPLLVFLLTPWFVARWVRHAREGHELTSIRKMAIGAGGVALSYLLLAAVAAFSGGGVVAEGWVWLVIFFVVMTAGELYILPIGLGLFGRLAPNGFTATTIALWFLAAFFGNLLAGAFGTLWSSLSPPQFFATTAAIAALSGALLLAFNRPAQRAEKGNLHDHPRLLSVVVAALAATLAFADSPAARTAVPLTAADAAAFLDGMLPSSMAIGDIAGATVSIVKDDALLLTTAYGFADVEKRIPVSAEQTLFRPASISKLFTWTAVMQQVEAGKLDLDQRHQRIPRFQDRRLRRRSRSSCGT